MRRLLLSSICIGFGFLMVVISAIATGQEQIEGELSAGTAIDTQTNLIEASDSAEMIGRQTKSQPEYYLPYPGILPDHVLYPLKMIRDRIRLLMANSPSKRVELQLLYANKRIGAAQALVVGGKSELGVDTAVKAEGYLSQAIASADELDQPSYWEELSLATIKHQHLLEEMKQGLEANNLSRAEDALETNQRLRQVVESKLPQVEQDVELPQEQTQIDPINPAEFGR